MGIVLETGNNIYTNIKNGASLEKTTTDALWDIGISGGIVVTSTIVGSFFGPAGSIAGYVAGFVTDAIVTIFVDGIIYSNGKTGRETIKSYS